MSTPNNPFEQIIIPSEIPSAWPPAPIYWLILLIVVATVALTVWLVKRHIQQQKVIKQALDSLQQLQQQPIAFAQLNQLLKGLCLHYYPRSQVASLTGKEWFDFMQQHSLQQTPPLFNHQDEFCQRLYQHHSICTEHDFNAAKRWIQQFPAQVSALKKITLAEQASAEKVLIGKKDV